MTPADWVGVYLMIAFYGIVTLLRWGSMFLFDDRDYERELCTVTSEDCRRRDRTKGFVAFLTVMLFIRLAYVLWRIRPDGSI